MTSKNYKRKAVEGRFYFFINGENKVDCDKITDYVSSKLTNKVNIKISDVSSSDTDLAYNIYIREGLNEDNFIEISKGIIEIIGVNISIYYKNNSSAKSYDYKYLSFVTAKKSKASSVTKAKPKAIFIDDSDDSGDSE
jgi:hypothetical protein